MGQDLAGEERFDAAIFGERDLLRVAQVGVGLILYNSRLAVDLGFEQASDRVGLIPTL